MSTPKKINQMLLAILLLFQINQQVSSDDHFDYSWDNIEIRGPKRFNDHIAIIGAGPAGIHMASLLKKEGFTRVDIYEASDQIGGKSKTVNVRGAAHDLGTVFMTTDYHENILQLAKDYGLEDDILDLVSNNIWRDGQDPQPYPHFLVTEVMRRLQTNNVTYTLIKIQQDIMKYNRLHNEIFGDYEGELMPRPSPATMLKINGTIVEYLHRNQLGAITPVFTLIHTMQGYGHLDEVPALYGLLWNTPKLMQTLIARLQNNPVSGVFILKSGFQNLWETIAKKDNLNIIYNAKIDKMKRTRNGHWIRYNCQRYHYDFVMWTPDMKSSIKQWIGASRWEWDTFNKLTHAYFTTTLVNTTKSKRGSFPIDYWVDNAFQKRDHSVWARRDSYGTIHGYTGVNYTQRIFPTGDDNSNMTTAVMYQYGKNEMDDSDVSEILISHLISIGAEEMSLSNQNTWPYFPRFNTKDVTEGIIWDIVEHQGKYNLWYIGSSVIFESVKSVVEYNKLLIKLMIPAC